MVVRPQRCRRRAAALQGDPLAAAAAALFPRPRRLHAHGRRRLGAGLGGGRTLQGRRRARRHGDHAGDRPRLHLELRHQPFLSGLRREGLYRSLRGRRRREISRLSDPQHRRVRHAGRLADLAALGRPHRREPPERAQFPHRAGLAELRDLREPRSLCRRRARVPAGAVQLGLPSGAAQARRGDRPARRTVPAAHAARRGPPGERRFQAEEDGPSRSRRRRGSRDEPQISRRPLRDRPRHDGAGRSRPLAGRRLRVDRERALRFGARGPVMSHAAAPPIGLARLGPLWLLVFVDAMGFAMIVPILAANPLSSVPVVQALLYGIAVGIYPLATFFAAPLLGAMSDRHGRLPVMLVCGGGLVASYAAIALGFEIGSAALVIVGRLVGGLTAATQAVALAALADLGPAETKDARINIGLLSSSLGFVLGPVLSGALAGWGFGARFDRIAPLVAVVAIALATLAWLGATDRQAGRPIPVGTGAARLDLLGSLKELGQAFASPVLRRLSAIFLLQQLGWGAFFFFIPVFLIGHFGLRAAEVSYFMGVMGPASA
ncbi:MFS transporter [Rhizobiales bacterium Sp-1]|uniref:MFS transporter n=2 Tax=Segnochrobactrum spirostomi TaxID=2608987 RepID=A0A6A7Y5W7_9HYPH|nr:MFS transporter [Segnochrobactrum spirostomi]